MDRVGVDVRGEAEDLDKRNSFEVVGGLRAVRIKVDGDEVSENYEVDGPSSL